MAALSRAIQSIMLLYCMALIYIRACVHTIHDALTWFFISRKKEFKGFEVTINLNGINGINGKEGN